MAATGSEKEKMAGILQASDYVMTRCIAASDDALRALLSLNLGVACLPVFHWTLHTAQHPSAMIKLLKNSRSELC